MGNTAVHNPRKVYSQYVDSGAIAILSNNVYKVTYYEIISGASGTITVPTGATINAGEFAGANCVLSEIDGSNKPTYVTPLDGGGNPVTATLNVGTGAWVKSAATVSVSVALIYSVNIAAINYNNLNNFYIIDSIFTTYTADESTLTLTGSTFSIKSQTSANFMAKISDATGTGVMVRATSPTFTTDITTPLIIGGSAVGSVIQYKGTSGVGTSTVAAHQFLVGNNGGTTAMSVYNSGNVNIGNAVANPTPTLGLVRIGQGTSFIDIGEFTASTSGLWMQSLSPTIFNYTIKATSSGTDFNGAGTLRLGVSSATVATFGLYTMSFNTFGASTSGANTAFTFVPPAHTNQTLSTNIPNFKVTGSTKQWATGALATQYFNYFSANTVSFVGASTATNVYGLYVEAATAGSYATISNNWAIGTNGDIALVNATAKVSAPIGSLTLYGNSQTIINCSGVSNIIVDYYKIGFNGSAMSSGAHTTYTFNNSANTNQTLSTNIPNFKVTGSTKQWATGTLTTQYFNYFSANTVSFVGASTATLAANLSVDYVQGGTNATITTNAAIYVPTLALTNTTTGIGLLVNAPTGATASNLAAKFAGGSTVMSGAALATTATDGFLYVPSCAGLPTGVPTAQTGTIPVVVDSTNNKMYIYSGGAWVALN